MNLVNNVVGDAGSLARIARNASRPPCVVWRSRAIKRFSGFTLLELLIVIAIISILTAVATVSYSSAQKKSRDSRRTSDLKAIQNAFEQYYADHNGIYPTNADCTVSATYLPAGMPTDPKTGVAYAPVCVADGKTYCVCTAAALEGTAGNSNASCGYGSGAFFCVSNLQ